MSEMRIYHQQLADSTSTSGEDTAFGQHYRLGDTAIRRRLATARPSLNAGMNFQVKEALISSGSAPFTFPTASADLTFPAPSTIRSRSNSGCGSDVAGRCKRIGSGGTTSNLLPGSDLLTASKTRACFFLRLGGTADVASASLCMPR